MDEWRADWGNDPDKNYSLIIEMREGDKWRGRLERDSVGQLLLVVYPSKSVFRIPAEWLTRLLAQAADDLPHAVSDDPRADAEAGERMNGWTKEVDRFQLLTVAQRPLWLARLIFALTLEARSTYVPGGDSLENPQRMRRLNELVHRVASQLRHCLENSQGPPDEVFLRAIGQELEALQVDLTQLSSALHQQRPAPEAPR